MRFFIYTNKVITTMFIVLSEQIIKISYPFVRWSSREHRIDYIDHRYHANTGIQPL